MSSASDWIAQNYNHLHKRLSVIKSPDWDDIFHEVLMAFMDMDSEKTNMLIEDDNAEKYIKQMFYWNCIGTLSPFQWKYNTMNTTKLLDNIQYEIEDDGIKYITELCWGDYETIMWEIDSFFVYKHLYTAYIKEKIMTPSYSIKKMSIESLVPYATLNVKFNNIRRQMEIEMKKIIK